MDNDTSCTVLDSRRPHDLIEQRNDSGSETICDDEDNELTEEDEDEDEDENATENDSTPSGDNSDGESEEIPLSRLSSEIQTFLQQNPQISKNFEIHSKIGEGILYDSNV
jgi:hypothetical protein